MGEAAKRELAAATRAKPDGAELPHPTAYDAVDRPPEIWDYDHGGSG